MASLRQEHALATLCATRIDEAKREHHIDKVSSKSSGLPRSRTHLVEDNVNGVIAQGIDVLLMVVHPTFVPILENNAIFCCTVVPITALASHHDDDVGFDVQECRFLQTLRGVQAYWAYTLCMMLHTSDHTSGRGSATATTTHSMSVPMVPAEHLTKYFDENLRSLALAVNVSR